MEAILFNVQKFCLHDGPGIRSTVFFKGCNLRCRWCANPESQSGKVGPRDDPKLGVRRWTLDEVVAEVCRDRAFYDGSGGGVTLSGGEPLLQPDFVCALCDRLHENKILVAIETAACVPEAVFSRALGKLDIVQLDLKHHDPEAHRRGTGVGNGRILRNLDLAEASGKPVFVRVPVIPGYNDALSDASAYAALLKAHGVRAVQLLPFHQMGEKKYETLGMAYDYKGVAQLHDEDLAPYADVLKAAGVAVQIGG